MDFYDIDTWILTVLTMGFSEPNESDDNDTSVKGQYNPATSMGGPPAFKFNPC